MHGHRIHCRVTENFHRVTDECNCIAFTFQFKSRTFDLWVIFSWYKAKASNGHKSLTFNEYENSVNLI